MSKPQHHKKLAWITATGLAIAFVAAIGAIPLSNHQSLWHRIAGPEVDGAWKFQTIDGINVSEVGYSLSIEWREIKGYYNGCNSCGFSEEQHDGGPSRIVTCTLVACDPKPYDGMFGRFAFGSPDMAMDGNNLILTIPGHRAELVRKTKAR